MDEVLKIINPMSSTIFWSIMVFAILVFLLWRFAVRPINNIISERQKEIRKDIDDAETKREEAQKYLEEQKRNLEEAKEEARKIIEDSKIAAQKIKDEVIEEAYQKSRAMIDSALEEIRKEREESINEIKDKIVEMVLMTTEKMIYKELSDEEHKKLIAQSLKEIEKIK